MSLKANEYPSVWEFSDENPSPKNYPTWVDARVRVRKFVDVFLRPQFFGRIVIWGKKSWFTDRCNFGKIVNGFCVLDDLSQVELIRYPIENSAETGHFSVLFVPLSADIFLEKILESRHYGEFKLVTIETRNLYWEHGQDITFLESESFRDGERIFTFSHDAQYLYEIFR